MNSFELVPTFPIQTLFAGLVFLILAIFFGWRISYILFVSKMSTKKKVISFIVLTILFHLSIVVFGGMIYNLF